jgi:hypothetical protein
MVTHDRFSIQTAIQDYQSTGTMTRPVVPRDSDIRCDSILRQWHKISILSVTVTHDQLFYNDKAAVNVKDTRHKPVFSQGQ